MISLFLLLTSCLTALTGAHQIPCNSAPEHGVVTVSQDGLHNFRCSDPALYELMGRDTAICRSDGYLDIASLPKCVVKQPLTKHIKSTHNNVRCTKEEVKIRHDLFLKFLSQADCVRNSKCIYKEMKYDCLSSDKVVIETVYVVLDQPAEADITSWANKMSETRLSRRRRSFNFDDATTEDPVVSSCETGQGVSSDGTNCVDCPEGMYGDGAQTPQCKECPVGQYNTLTKQSQCTACTDGKSTLTTGSTSADDCTNLCTLPAISENSQYTVAGVAQGDGTNVAVGTAFTLLCDQGYTFKNTNSLLQTCTEGLATSDIRNECFQVTTSPDEAEYKFLGETATITCVGASKVDPHLVEVRTPYPNGLSVALVAGSDTYDATNDVEKPQFDIGSAATPGRFSLSCDMQVFSDVSEKEQSSDSIPLVFVKTIAPTASQNGEVGTAFSIAAKVSKDDSSSYSFSWTKNGNAYSTYQNSEETESGVTYKVSSVSITELALDDAGTYVATVAVSDSSGNEKLTKSFTSVLVIRGFFKQAQTATGATSLTQTTGSTATLTCVLKGTVPSSELFTWTEADSKTDLNDDANFVVTPKTDGDLVYRYLEIASWPSGWSNKELKCKVLKKADSSVVYQTDAISLSTSSYSVTMDAADKCIDVGNDQTFTCTASFPDSITNGPTVTWYKVIDGAEDQLIETGDSFVVTGSKDGTSYKSILTVDSAKSTQAGSYYCVATYTEPSYLQITKKDDAKSLNVVDLADIPKKQVLIGATDVKFETTFSGQQPLLATWMNGNTELANGVDYTVVNDVSAANGPYTLSLTVKTVSDTTPTSFKLVLNLKAACDTLFTSNEYTKTAELEPLTAEISTDATQFQDKNDYAFAGSDVKFTCSYTKPEDLAAPTVTWTATATKGGTAIATGTPDNSAAASTPTGKVVITLSSVTVDGHSGTYSCSAAYPNSIGTKTSSTRTLHVLGFKPVVTTYVGQGGSTKLTCTFTGRTGVVTWAKSGENTDLSSRVTAGTYENGEITSELSFTNAQQAADEGQYSCIMNYADITDDPKQLQPWLKIMRITEVTTSTVNNELGSNFDLDCATSWPVGDLSYTPTVSWKLTDKDGVEKPLTLQTDHYKYSVASAAATDMGLYECKIDFDGVTVTGTVTVYVRSVPVLSMVGDPAANFQAPSTVLFGAGVTVTLSCVFSGDAIGQVTWFKGSSIMTDPTSYEFPATVPSTYGAISTAIIKSVTDETPEGDYKCKTSYTSDNKETEAPVVTLGVVGASGVVSSKAYANKGDPVTLTCSYYELTGDNKPAAWTVPGIASPVSSSDTGTTSEYSLASATVDNNGVVTCTVTYSNSLSNAVTVTQYVRDTVFENLYGGKLYGLLGQQVILTCTVHGDQIQPAGITWSYEGGTKNTESYSSESTKGTLTIAQVAESDGVAHTCEATYTQDNAQASATQTLTVLKATVEGTATVNKGTATTLTCNPVEAASSYSWKKGTEVVSGETQNTLTLTGVDFSATADYKCVVVYDHSLGSLESPAFSLFVRGFVSLVQINKLGAYNEIGETITLKATIKNPGSPTGFKLFKGDTEDTISNSPSPSKNEDGDWEVDVEFAATAVVGNSAVFKVVVEGSGSIEESITMEIYAKCTMAAVADIALLNGDPLDHMGTVSGLACGGGKTLIGSTEASCNDGIVTWTANAEGLAQQPECIAVETNPVDQLVEVGKETTMSCVSIFTPVTVPKVEWFTDAGVVHTDDSPTAAPETGDTGRNKYTSQYTITGAENLNDVGYKCRMFTDTNKKVESESAKVYIVGIKSFTPTFPGLYFESDGSGDPEYSESASVAFEVYVGPDISTATGALIRSDGQDSEVAVFTAGTVSNNIVTYTYNIAEGNKKSGEYQLSVTYTKPVGANGAEQYTSKHALTVYQFCKTNTLDAGGDSSWSPTPKVEHRGYATFSCGSDDKIAIGDTVVQCLMGTEAFQFETPDPAPQCVPKSDLIEKCGKLSESPPVNGDIVYKDENTAYFTCGAGYTLVGAEDEYTCNAETKSWSIITVDNPTGEPPYCQATSPAEDRYVEVSDLKMTVTSNLCADGAGIGQVEDALRNYVQDQNIVTCTNGGYCSWGGFSCTHNANVLTVGFRLTQTHSLSDKTLVTADGERIKADLVDKAIPVNTGKKRETQTATVTSVTVATETTCSSSTVEVDNSCTLCPAGWGVKDGTCNVCAIGSYGTENNKAACTQCSDSKTTYNIGSTAQSDCKEESDICTVPVSDETATYSPPSGSRIPFNTLITVSCATNHATEISVASVFKCGAVAPQCYENCNLAEMNTDDLKAKFIHAEDVISKSFLRHKESLTVACMSGYELEEDQPSQVYTCNAGELPAFAECVEAEGSQVLTTVIVCVVVLGVAVILLFLFIIVQWRKKKNAASYKMRSEKHFQDPIENMAAAEEGTGVQMKKVTLKLSEADKKAPLMSRPVHISDFSKYYDLLTRNDDRELKHEFGTFDGFDDNNTCYHGSIPENDMKNRYKNIIPFDHSRVKLSIINDDVHSDYINASYIHGYHKPRVFIATQAPLYETLDDFWRMIWEKKTTMIVNLTKIEENGKIKSISYWPSVEEGAKQFGLVNVRRLDKQETEYFVVYTFEIKHKIEGDVREVFMFNYVGWPDFDVPTRTTEFVNFIYNIRHLLFIRPPMGPIVCHCSAGTGRTGAYIGIMNSLDRLINKEDLDLLGLVGSLRQQRRKMVFTNTQYKFLHRVMMDIVTNDNFDLLKQSGFRKKIDVQGVLENPYVSTSESDELDELNDTKV
ncbi:hypothetical protein ACHWQZ_G009090 [Mnemiopsis leidyi]